MIVEAPGTICFCGVFAIGSELRPVRVSGFRLVTKDSANQERRTSELKVTKIEDFINEC
jgi:hypothetical protein